MKKYYRTAAETGNFFYDIVRLTTNGKQVVLPLLLMLMLKLHSAAVSISSSVHGHIIARVGLLGVIGHYCCPCPARGRKNRPRRRRRRRR